MLKEICEYDIDGLFCDCTEYFPCHCNRCTADIIALGMDPKDENAAAMFSQILLRRVFEEIKVLLGPDKYLYLNGMSYHSYRESNPPSSKAVWMSRTGSYSYQFQR